jgi:hypothetical protein
LDNQFPTHTAGNVTLPDGRSVWIKTLNGPERDDSRECADFFAAEAVLVYRKGGSRYTALLAEFEDADTAHQCDYLAEAEFMFGDAAQQLAEKYVHPERPERGDKDDDQYDAALDGWRKDCISLTDKREKAEAAFVKREKDKASNLSEKVRVERCVGAAKRRKRREVFMRRFLMEVLWRAVRTADDHAAKFYESSDAVAELDDDLRDLLTSRYYNHDPVAPTAIPIMAADSSV